MSDDSEMAWGTALPPMFPERKPWVDPGPGRWRGANGAELAIKDMTDKHVVSVLKTLDRMTEIKVWNLCDGTDDGFTEPLPAGVLEGPRQKLIEHFYPKYAELRAEADRRKLPPVSWKDKR